MRIYLTCSHTDNYNLVICRLDTFDRLEFNIPFNIGTRIQCTVENLANLSLIDTIKLSILFKEILSEKDWRSFCDMFPHILRLIRKHKINALNL